MVNNTVANALIDPQYRYHIARDGRGGRVCIVLLRSLDDIVDDSDVFSDLDYCVLMLLSTASVSVL